MSLNIPELFDDMSSCLTGAGPTDDVEEVLRGVRAGRPAKRCLIVPRPIPLFGGGGRWSVEK